MNLLLLQCKKNQIKYKMQAIISWHIHKSIPKRSMRVLVVLPMGLSQRECNNLIVWRSVYKVMFVYMKTLSLFNGKIKGSLSTNMFKHNSPIGPKGNYIL